MLNNEPTGKRDALGNDIHKATEIGTPLARFTPFTEEEIRTLGRDVIRTQQKLLLQNTFDTSQRFNQVVLDGITYHVKSMRLLTRFVTVNVEAFSREGVADG